MNDTVPKLLTTKPDAEVAAEFKKKLTEALLHVCRICDEIEAAGLEVGFGTGRGPIGAHIITQLRIAKVL